MGRWPSAPWTLGDVTAYPLDALLARSSCVGGRLAAPWALAVCPVALVLAWVWGRMWRGAAMAQRILDLSPVWPGYAAPVSLGPGYLAPLVDSAVPLFFGALFLL